MRKSTKINVAEKKLKIFEAKMMREKQRLAKLRAKTPLREVTDYSFVGGDGKSVSLKKLFGRGDELILIHNMGRRCTYCSLWADGFNGLLPQIERRAAFVVETPDQINVQKKLARKRGWKFKMISSNGTTFRSDMGYESKKGFPFPGVSTFVRKGQKIYRAANASFGPGDNFCVAWDLFDLLPGRHKGFKPLSNRL